MSNYNLFWPRDELFDTCRSIQRHLRKGLSSARHFYCHDASRRQSQSDPNDPTGLFNLSLLFFLWLMAHSNRSFRDDGLDLILFRVAFILLQGVLLYKVADSLHGTGLDDNVLRAVLKAQPGFVTYCRSAYRYYFSATTLFPPLLAFVIFALIFLLAKLNNNRPQSSSSITNIETG